MADPDRERTEKKGESRFWGGNSPSGLQCRAALIVPSASALRPRGLGVRTESARAQSFCFQVQADLSAERHSPFWARARQCRNLFSFAHPPSLFHAVPSGTASASALKRRSSGFRYPRRSGLAELIVLYEGTILAMVYDDSPFTFGFTWTLDRLLGYSCLRIPYRFRPRLFLCSPSFRRCGITGTVFCGSGCFP